MGFAQLRFLSTPSPPSAEQFEHLFVIIIADAQGNARAGNRFFREEQEGDGIQRHQISFIMLYRGKTDNKNPEEYIEGAQAPIAVSIDIFRERKWSGIHLRIESIPFHNHFRFSPLYMKILI